MFLFSRGSAGSYWPRDERERDDCRHFAPFLPSPMQEEHKQHHLLAHFVIVVLFGTLGTHWLRCFITYLMQIAPCADVAKSTLTWASHRGKKWNDFKCGVMSALLPCNKNNNKNHNAFLLKPSFQGGLGHFAQEVNSTIWYNQISNRLVCLKMWCKNGRSTNVSDIGGGMQSGVNIGFECQDWKGSLVTTHNHNLLCRPSINRW